MRRHLTKTQGRPDLAVSGIASHGFSLVELCIVMAIILVMAAMSIPVIQSTLAFYDLQGAVAAISGTINATRYHAVSDSFPYRVTFNQANNTYQVSSCPSWVPTDPTKCDASDVGNPVPFGGSRIELKENIAFQFMPSGKVSIIAGSSPFTVSRRTGPGSSDVKTKSITVSNYGSIKVK